MWATHEPTALCMMNMSCTEMVLHMDYVYMHAKKMNCLL